jgi:hypothetical protein
MDNVHSTIFEKGCQVEKRQKLIGFGIMDIARLVGIQPTLLNKLIQREKYGIGASVRAGKGQGKERLFSQDDVYGIALAYWLFESGLRSDSIQYVLNQICGGKLHSSANDAAFNVLHHTNAMLVVSREPRSGYEKYPKQVTRLVDGAEASRIVRGNTTTSILTIPVGSLFASLKRKMGGE